MTWQPVFDDQSTHMLMGMRRLAHQAFGPLSAYAPSPAAQLVQTWLSAKPRAVFSMPPGTSCWQSFACHEMHIWKGLRDAEDGGSFSTASPGMMCLTGFITSVGVDDRCWEQPHGADLVDASRSAHGLQMVCLIYSIDALTCSYHVRLGSLLELAHDHVPMSAWYICRCWCTLRCQKQEPRLRMARPMRIQRASQLPGACMLRPLPRGCMLMTSLAR